MSSLSASATPFAPIGTKTPNEEFCSVVATGTSPKPTQEARLFCLKTAVAYDDTFPPELSTNIRGYLYINPRTESAQWRIPNPLFPDAVSEIDGSVSGILPIKTYEFSIPIDVFNDAQSWHWSVIKTA